MAKTQIGEWLEKKFLQWQSEQGERKTLDSFAQYIGVTRSALNKWMNGDRTPDANYADLIADKLGPEIYDLLGLPRPDPRLQTIIKHWGEYPESVKDDLLSRAENHHANGSTPESSNRVVAQPKRKQKV